jgi:peptide/nickel transport system substrate-binding protein
LLLAVLCVACGRGERPAPATTSTPAAAVDDSTPRDGGTVVRRLDTDIATVNPVIPTSRYDSYVAQYLFTSLIRLDRNLQPAPGLAESWEVSDDGLLYRFALNPKATFSDGRPVRASDVLFTIRKIVDPKSEALQTVGSFALLDLPRTRVIDDRTIEIAFKRSLAMQLIRFAEVRIVPEHVYGKGDFRKDFNDRAVGSGPYTLTRRVAGKEVVLDRRKDYWETRPHIQTVIFRVIADHGTAFNALRLGEIDETLVASDTWLRERNNPEIAKKIEFQRFYTRNFNFIGWNNRHPVLRDQRVRRALTMCIPIEPIVKQLFHGTARAMSGQFMPDEWAYNPNVAVVRHDLEGAKQLLAAAGWADGDGDGVLEKDGKALEFELLIMTGSATSKQLAQMLQAELKKVGVQQEIVMMDAAMAIQRMFSGNYEAAYLSWDLDPDPDPYALFHSSQFPPVGQNFVFYSNPEADRLIEAGRVELDPARRKEIYWRLHEVLSADQPYSWVVQVSAKWGVNKRVKNVVPSRGQGFFLWYPGELDWWIAGDRR